MKTLRQLRFSAGLTQESLARSLDVSLSILQRWEAGARPKASSRRRIAAFFDVAEHDVAWPEEEERIA
jgi:transcriptional regulator with XRE-family HTH domain